MTPLHKTPADRGPEPRGFGEHSRGLAGEYAHEQGWGLEAEQRMKSALHPNGSSDYDYGARDFGDEALHLEETEPNVQPSEPPEEDLP